MNFTELETEAKVGVCEWAKLDFKGRFDPSANADWCELIKDIAAMANSGGGSIIFGLDDDGQPTGLDCTGVLAIDPADISNKIHKYTGKHFSDFRLIRIDRVGLQFGCLMIQAASVPLVFVAPGEYERIPGQKKSAFATGTVYFRHGAKSQPGTSDDSEAVLKREIALVREIWLGRLRQVVEAPDDASIRIVPAGGVRLDESSDQAIRITNDPSAPAHRLADPNVTHPFRQKEVLVQVNAAFAGSASISSHDLLCARRLHKVDANPVYCYRGRFASPTYSQAFVGWLVSEHRADGGFFVKCRAGYKANSRQS